MLMPGVKGEPVCIVVAPEICQRTGTKALLAGSIAAVGAHYVIDTLATGTGANRNYGGVVSIDYVKAGETVAAPFCVAMTLESKLEAK